MSSIEAGDVTLTYNCPVTGTGLNSVKEISSIHVVRNGALIAFPCQVCKEEHTIYLEKGKQE